MEWHLERFPFSLASTSYLVPFRENNLVQNVRFASGFVKQIQLLFFEYSYFEEVAEDGTLTTLQALADEKGLTYIVHLPLDIKLLFLEGEELAAAISKIISLIERTDKLGVSHYILHLDPSCKGEVGDGFDVGKSLDEKEIAHSAMVILDLLKTRSKDYFSKICLENTYYDLRFCRDAIFKTDIKICIDIGHLYLCNLEIEPFLESFEKKIEVVHLHGFREGKDHQGLDKTPNDWMIKIDKFLARYQKTVVIEVFSRLDFFRSIKVLISRL